MNNAGIVIACFAWLITTSSGLNLMAKEFEPGAAVAQVSVPAGIPTSANTTADFQAPCEQGGITGDCIAHAIQFGLDCALNVFTLTLIGSCSPTTRSQTFTVISTILIFVSGAFIFLFQLATGQIPFLPRWLVFVIIGPPAAGLAYIAFETIARSR